MVVEIVPKCVDEVNGLLPTASILEVAREQHYITNDKEVPR